MITICTYCRKQIGEKEPLEDKRISHGACAACSEYHMAKILEVDLSKQLGNYESPVIMVDEEGRLMGVNQQMTSFLGKTKEEILGLLGGELLGCQYARLSEGCGQTSHCDTCTIRQLVTKTRESQTDFIDVPAFLDQDEQRIHFRLSAYHRGEFVEVVMLKVESIEPLPADVSCKL